MRTTGWSRQEGGEVELPDSKEAGWSSQGEAHLQVRALDEESGVLWPVPQTLKQLLRGAWNQPPKGWIAILEIGEDFVRAKHSMRLPGPLRAKVQVLRCSLDGQAMGNRFPEPCRGRMQCESPSLRCHAV